MAGVAEKRRQRERSNVTGSDDEHTLNDTQESEYADPISEALRQVAQRFAEVVSAQLLRVLNQESAVDGESSSVETITPDTVCEASDALSGLQSLCHSFYSYFGNAGERTRHILRMYMPHMLLPPCLYQIWTQVSGTRLT